MADLHVALLGTGIMGLGMGRSMRRAGLPLRVWNRTRERAEPLAADGATVASTARDAVDGADVIVTMLTDGAATEAVMGDALAGATPGAVWVQMGTIGVAEVERLVGLAQDREVALVDAPVSGTKQPAEAGRLVVLAAGPTDAVQRAQPVFDAVGSRTVFLGTAVGDAMRMKMVVNGWLLDVLVSLGEALALAKQAGLKQEAFLSVIKDGPLDMPYAQLKGHQILAGDYEESFPLAHGAKDARLMLDAAVTVGADLPVGEVVAGLLAVAEGEGYGRRDVAAVAEIIGSPRR